MKPLSAPPRTRHQRASVTVSGKTLDEMLKRADELFADLFGEHEYDIIGSMAEPLLRTPSGQVELWEANIEAELL